MKHLRDIDGLRGIAVLMVVLFHLRKDIPGGAPGLINLGWSGVELFFVISGFLITSILIAARDGDSYFKNFYARRALRIFPIYYIFIAIAVFFALRLGKTGALDELPWYLLYLQSIPMMASEFRSVLFESGHTWTLAIEEQFYWIWPFVVWKIRGRAFLFVLGAMFIGAPLFRWATVHLTGNTFFVHAVLPSQVDSLAAGAFLAVLTTRQVATATILRVGVGATVGGGVAVGVLVAMSDGFAAFNGARIWTKMPHNLLLLSAMSVLFCGLVALAVASPKPLRWLFQNPVLVRLGTLSYGIYLFHPLLLRLVRSYQRDLTAWVGDKELALWLALGIKLMLFYVVAEISWRLIESRILRLKKHFASTPAASMMPTAATPEPASSSTSPAVDPS